MSTWCGTLKAARRVAANWRMSLAVAVTLVQHHGRSNILPQARVGHCKSHRLGHRRMLHEYIVHFLRGNFFSATVDDLLDTARNE